MLCTKITKIKMYKTYIDIKKAIIKHKTTKKKSNIPVTKQKRPGLFCPIEAL